MTSRKNVLRATLQSDHVGELMRGIIASRPEFSSLPQRVLANLSKPITASATWLDDGLAAFKRSLSARWRGPSDPAWPLVAATRGDGDGGAVQVHLEVEWSAPCVVEQVVSLGAWLAVFDHFYYGSSGWNERRSFDGLHVDLGWGCMFVGDKGHERLVSRRWLEHGPWWLRRFPGDVSLIQFHDLDADPETALAQALPGHRRMSDHDIGGWLRSSYRPVSTYNKDIPEFRALYVPSDQSLRVVCSPGRTVTQPEMLDACAERLVASYSVDKPVRSLRYVFIDPADVDRHLHELWLRDIEVWTIVDGKEVRVDTDYRPKPSPPDWVLRLRDQSDQ